MSRASIHALADWVDLPDEQRLKVRKLVGGVASKMSFEEAQAGKEPSEEYWAYATARGLLFYLMDPKNIETLSADYKVERARREKTDKEG